MSSTWGDQDPGQSSETAPDELSNMPPTAADHADFNMATATQATEQHYTYGETSEGYGYRIPHGCDVVPHLLEACGPYPFRTGVEEYHAQKQAAWTPDGVCMLQLGEDMCLRTHRAFPLPSRTVSVYEAPESVTAFAASPFFNTWDDTSLRVLAAVKNQPIYLFDVNNPASQQLAPYHTLVGTDDVSYVPTNSIKFLPDCQHFIAAGLNCLSIFHLDRPAPIQQLFTHVKSRKMNKARPLALNSSISSIDYRHDGLLAVSTWAGKLGLYEEHGSGDILWVENVSDYREVFKSRSIQSIRWSPCGHYLYVIEKETGAITIREMRMNARRVMFLHGHRSGTQQRLGFDLLDHGNGLHQAIAGGSDGVVRLWDNPTARSSCDADPDIEWRAHDDHVAAVCVNPRWPDFMATTAGSRRLTTEDDYQTSNEPSNAEDTSDSEESSESEDSSESEESSDTGSDGGAKKMGAPVPEGWMKIWRW